MLLNVNCFGNYQREVLKIVSAGCVDVFVYFMGRLTIYLAYICVHCITITPITRPMRASCEAISRRIFGSACKGR